MRDDIERDPLEWGIRAYGHGELAAARGLFRRAIETEPANEQAWFWMAEAAETSYERSQYLRRVLEMNPGNQLAAGLLQDLVQAGMVPELKLDLSQNARPD